MACDNEVSLSICTLPSPSSHPASAVCTRDDDKFSSECTCASNSGDNCCVPAECCNATSWAWRSRAAFCDSTFGADDGCKLLLVEPIGAIVTDAVGVARDWDIEDGWVATVGLLWAELLLICCLVSAVWGWGCCEWTETVPRGTVVAVTIPRGTGAAATEPDVPKGTINT